MLPVLYGRPSNSSRLKFVFGATILKDSRHWRKRSAVMQETRFVIEEIAPKKNYEHRLMGYNNDPTTKFEDIKRVLALVEKRISTKLKQEPQK